MTNAIIFYLEHFRDGGAREVEALEELRLRVILAAVAFDHDGFRRALLADQQHGLALLGDRFDQKVRSYVVHVGDENRAVLGRGVLGIDVFWHLTETTQIAVNFP